MLMLFRLHGVGPNLTFWQYPVDVEVSQQGFVVHRISASFVELTRRWKDREKMVPVKTNRPPHGKLFSEK
jgi:hypothetical protein